MKTLDQKTNRLLLTFQKNEISEYHIYERLSQLEKTEQTRLNVKKISADELRHYNIYKSHTGQEVWPNRLKIWWYLFLARIFGITFSVKLMENGEKGAQDAYRQMIGVIPEIEQIINDEKGHEKELVKLINEEKLKYIGAVVLGMNDALVELTGTLAGLTFALQNEKLVGVAGLITGVAAALSMAASEYLSAKVNGEMNPLKAAFYTGLTYIIVVFFLVLPFLLLSNPFTAMSLTLLAAAIMIGFFNYYYSVVKEVPFSRRFMEMLIISFGVAFLSFVIGLIIRQFLGINV